MKNIAIDGPSGAGKSTIAKAVSEKLGFIYIDTGAMYRTVGLFCVRRGLDPKTDISDIEKVLPEVEIDIRHIDHKQHIFLSGEDVSELIRTPEISLAASNVAVIPAVRLKMVELQRNLAKMHDCVMDGRDIGTYVLPDAELKIFLTADVEDRAMRRFEELKQRGESVSFEEVLSDMKYRDKNDSSRSFAPLSKALDALLVDTTGFELEDSINLIFDIVSKKLS